MRFELLCIAMLLGACVSRTVSDARFRESASLSVPAFQVTLSDPEKFSFAVVGDLHIGNGDTDRFRRILQVVQSEGDSFIALLGDIADEGELTDYQAVQSALSTYGYGSRVIPVIGNHDIFNAGWENYRQAFGASHFSVATGNSRFIALDTADGTVGEDQFAWLEEQLAIPTHRHTFLLSHYLPVVPGQKTYLRLANESEALRLMKLASNRGVRGWLGAHYHSFILDSIEGVSYLVAGGGGGRRMEPVKDFFFVQVSVDGPTVQYTLRVVNP